MHAVVLVLAAFVGFEAPEMRQHVAIALDQGVLEHAVAHGPAVHEQVHAREVAAVPVGPGHPAVGADASLGGVHRHQRLGLALA